jgi:hypothetical protein
VPMPHPQSEIEAAGVHEQPLEHVLMSAYVRAPQPTGLIEMRTRSLEQFASHTKEAFPRALRLVRAAGFAEAARFCRSDGAEFVVLVRQPRRPHL